MSPRFTVDDYGALPEGFPAQLIQGFLVKEPSPTYGHQGVAQRILRRLWDVIGLARTRHEVGVRLDRWNAYHPDVAAYAEPLPADERDSVLPLAVFEVLSPSTRRYDRGVKVRRYLASGVREVWLLDASDRSVELHTTAGMRVATGEDRIASAALPGFSLAPPDAFDDPEEPAPR